jgi:hypothetical protein
MTDDNRATTMSNDDSREHGDERPSMVATTPGQSQQGAELEHRRALARGPELASVPQTFARWARTLEGYGVELEMGASVLDDWRKVASAPPSGEQAMPHVVAVACVEAARHLRAAAESLVRAQVEFGKIDGVIAASIAKR